MISAAVLAMSSNPSYAKKIISPPVTICTGDFHVSRANLDESIVKKHVTLKRIKIASLTNTMISSARPVRSAPIRLIPTKVLSTRTINSSSSHWVSCPIISAEP
ncbi:hypothetical protein D1872_266170 [compost metagenome]